MDSPARIRFRSMEASFWVATTITFRPRRSAWGNPKTNGTTRLVTTMDRSVRFIFKKKSPRLLGEGFLEDQKAR